MCTAIFTKKIQDEIIILRLLTSSITMTRFVSMSARFTALAALLSGIAVSVFFTLPPADLALANGSSTAPDCRGYTTWPSSATYNPDAEWDFMFMPVVPGTSITSGGGVRGGYFADVNGDGLLDYMYNESPNNNSMGYCLALGTGAGWEVKFRCWRIYDKGMFYGDCAKQ